MNPFEDLYVTSFRYPIGSHLVRLRLVMELVDNMKKVLLIHDRFKIITKLTKALGQC